jgi:hypothetical protein
MLAAGEVLMMAVMGEFLGYDQDVAINHCFSRQHPGWFPALQRGGWPSSLASPWCSPC